MAIKKDIELDTGAVASYWKISALETQTGGGTKVTLWGYVSQAKRTAGKSPCAHMVFNIPQEIEDGRGQMYTHLKTLPEFAGGEDV